MSIKVGPQNLPATLQRSLGYKPAETDVTVAFVHGAKLGLTANIRDFNSTDSALIAQQLAEHVQKQQPTELIYVGWGPQGNDNAMDLLGRIAQDHTAPDHTALHVDNNQVRVMTIGLHEQWQPPLELTEPPMAVIMELPAPHTNRDDFKDAYAPLDTPQFGRPDTATQQTYADLPPSMRGEIVNRLLDRLVEDEPADNPYIQTNLAYLMADDREVRDFAIISGLEDPRKAQALIDLYRAAPENLHGPLGVAAAVGAFRTPGGTVAAETLLRQANEAPNGLGTGKRLHELLTMVTDSGLTPEPVLKGLVTADRTEDIAKADKEWHAARTSTQVASRLPEINDPVDLNFKPPMAIRHKPQQPPTTPTRKPTL